MKLRPITTGGSRTVTQYHQSRQVAALESLKAHTGPPTGPAVSIAGILAPCRTMLAPRQLCGGAVTG